MNDPQPYSLDERGYVLVSCALAGVPVLGGGMPQADATVPAEVPLIGEGVDDA